MTIEQFKEEFKARESFQSYSDEFKSILNEVLKAFQIKSYLSDEGNWFLGDSVDQVHFGYIPGGNLFIVRENIFYSILKDIAIEKRILFLSFCFCKYFSLDLQEKHNAICCSPNEMEVFLEYEGELYHWEDEFYNAETGEVFKENDYKLEPEYLPYALAGTNCNMVFKNPVKFYSF